MKKKNIDEEIYEEEEKEENRRRYFIFILLFLIVLFFSTFGLTVSFYKGTPGDDNIITTDKIIFTYSDVDKGGSGINIKDAIPISDAEGKTQLGVSKCFDFSVTATSKKSNIEYKLLIRKNELSTLENSKLRIYLTSRNEPNEQPILLKTFSELEKENIDGKEYYVLYKKVLNKGIDNYTDSYRLRMWVKEDADNFQNKTFSLNVDVNAVQVGD